MTTPTNLRELINVLRDCPSNSDDAPSASAEYARANGLQSNAGDLDWSSLPTFGGDAPASTRSVLSWDETHLLVGDDPRDLEIVTREEWAEK